MKETQEFEELVEKTENFLSRVNKKVQRALVLRDSLQYDPVSQQAPPELIDVEGIIDKLKPLQEKLTKALFAWK